MRGRVALVPFAVVHRVTARMSAARFSVLLEGHRGAHLRNFGGALWPNRLIISLAGASFYRIVWSSRVRCHGLVAMLMRSVKSSLKTALKAVPRAAASSETTFVTSVAASPEAPCWPALWGRPLSSPGFPHDPLMETKTTQQWRAPKTGHKSSTDWRGTNRKRRPSSGHRDRNCRDTRYSPRGAGGRGLRAIILTHVERIAGLGAHDAEHAEVHHRRYLRLYDQGNIMRIDGLLDIAAGKTLKLALEAGKSRPAIGDVHTSD